MMELGFGSTGHVVEAGRGRRAASGKRAGRRANPLAGADQSDDTTSSRSHRPLCGLEFDLENGSIGSTALRSAQRFGAARATTSHFPMSAPWHLHQFALDAMNLRTAALWTARLLAALMFLASLYCAAWAVSSTGLAFQECDGRYELLAKDSRCRQPVLAEILALCLLIASGIIAFAGRRFRK